MYVETKFYAQRKICVCDETNARQIVRQPVSPVSFVPCHTCPSTAMRVRAKTTVSFTSIRMCMHLLIN